MNSAMMFALALGIDHALFLVVRYRAARMGQGASPRAAIAQTMGTAGKAVHLSGATVLISLSAVMLVPSPSFRSMVGPSDPALADTVDRLRADLPDSALVGGAAVENLDLKSQLDESTPLVIAIILVLGFESQGFLDAWAPVFFFAMIFAIAMDYTVFLLASAREHYESSGDPKDARVGALAHSGPLPPMEMGIVLGIAVLLDAFLVRLVLLPVLMRLTGKAAWWSPAWLNRVLPKITFSHG